MEPSKFSGLICLMIIGMLIIWGCPVKSSWGFRSQKKVKLKYFWFLFTEYNYENYETKEVRLSIIIFQLIGYIVNILLILFVILFYKIGWYKVTYYVSISTIISDVIAGTIFIAVI